MRKLIAFVPFALSLAACGSGHTTSSGSDGGGVPPFSPDGDVPPFSAGSGTGMMTGIASSAGTSVASSPRTSAGQTSSTGVASSGGAFPAGTICNDSGEKRTPPTTLKHVILIMFENENFGNVNGNASAPYISSLASKCGYASEYLDNMFTDNLESLPHYLALTSGSNCNTGLDKSGSGCIEQDQDATVAQLSTESIFGQVSSWTAYQEDMPSSCDPSASGNYAAKHNPPPYYSALRSCSANDVTIAGVTCPASTTMSTCSTPSNAFTKDLANGTLAQFVWVTPNLENDMHNGTVAQGDNWLHTYMPLILQSSSYLNGEIAVFIVWDEQSTSSFGGTTPNLFISPYITAGTVASTPLNHFSALRALENAFGITTYLGCASGTKPGGGTCPGGSTADLRAALNF